MDNISDNKKKCMNKYLNKKICDGFIIQYLKDRDFDSSIFYILRGYYPKTFNRKNSKHELEECISFLKESYLEKYYNYNENNINQIISEIGFIIKNGDDGLVSIRDKYDTTIENLNDFFLGKYSGTFLGTKVLPRYV